MTAHLLLLSWESPDSAVLNHPEQASMPEERRLSSVPPVVQLHSQQGPCPNWDPPASHQMCNSRPAGPLALLSCHALSSSTTPELKSPLESTSCTGGANPHVHPSLRHMSSPRASWSQGAPHPHLHLVTMLVLKGRLRCHLLRDAF